jgi:hypothetical protein
MQKEPPISTRDNISYYYHTAGSDLPAQVTEEFFDLAGVHQMNLNDPFCMSVYVSY